MKEMTVADLIDRLKEAPPDAAVQINIDTDNGYVTSRPTMAWLVVRQNLVDVVVLAGPVGHAHDAASLLAGAAGVRGDDVVVIE